jgi:hypothetical protein
VCLTACILANYADTGDYYHIPPTVRELLHAGILTINEFLELPMFIRNYLERYARLRKALKADEIVSAFLYNRDCKITQLENSS